MKDRGKLAKDADITKLDAEERFKRVGMKDDYDGLYSALSSDVHNNTSHLRYRHPQFTLYSGEGGYGDAILVTFSEILMFASELMHERFGDGKNSVKGIRYAVDPARERASKADIPKRARKIRHVRSISSGGHTVVR
jgi:hypothetical protein